MKDKKQLERELEKLNLLIDKKIIRGESYKKEAAAHRRVLKLLRV